MGGGYKAVTECPSQTCPLWLDRSGKRRKGQRPLKAIRDFCIQCTGGPEEVKKCTGRMLYEPDCQLHRYRFGKNPRKRGQGRVQNLLRLPNGKGVYAPETHEKGQRMVG